MKELRCIVFTDQEIIAAYVDRRKRLSDALPEGKFTGARHEQSDTLTVYLQVDGGPQEVKVVETELQAALVASCMSKGIPLPADAEKALYTIKGHVTLMITMNFRKSARSVARTVASFG